MVEDKSPRRTGQQQRLLPRRPRKDLRRISSSWRAGDCATTAGALSCYLVQRHHGGEDRTAAGRGPCVDLSRRPGSLLLGFVVAGDVAAQERVPGSHAIVSAGRPRLLALFSSACLSGRCNGLLRPSKNNSSRLLK